MSSGAIDMVATAAPGIKDILVLGKVKQLEREVDGDLIVLDAPAAGHAITFLRSARGLLDAVRVGPINTQAAEVLEMLTDPERCQVVLVTLPEETPVNELVETAYSLEDEVGVALGPVVVNGLYPDRPGLAVDPETAAAQAGVSLRAGEAEALAAAADFRRHRVQLQTEQVVRLARTAPAPPAPPALPLRRRAGPGRAGPAGHGADRPVDRARGAWRERDAGPRRVGRGHRLHRLGRRGQDHDGRGDGHGGGPPGPKRTAVVTIDPAKRLADALGLEGLTNQPGRIEGDWPGELWALMLDTKSTFDDLVAKYAETPEQAERILENRFYRNISGALSGTQEYMAMEKLYELHDESDFDLVVVDTPPTRNALDFLDAPRTLTRFLDHRLYQLLMAPTRGIVRAVNVAAQAFLRTVSKVVGGEVVEDAIAFFPAFDGMEEGFRNRADHVDELLDDDVTAVRARRRAPPGRRRGGRLLRRRLAEADIPVRALIVNRMHPRFGPSLAEAARERAETLAGTDLGDLYANLADFQLVASREEDHLGGPGRQGGAGAGSSGCRSCAPTCTTSTASAELGRYLFPRRIPRRAIGGSRPNSRARAAAGSGAQAGSARPGLGGQGASAASSTVSVTGTMRSKPVVCSRRVSVGRLHATATSPSASRARRMPPMSAPRPAESMNGTSDRSMSRRGVVGELGERLAELARPCTRRARRSGGRACSVARFDGISSNSSSGTWAVATDDGSQGGPGPATRAGLGFAPPPRHRYAPRPCPSCCWPPTPTGSSTRSTPPSATTPSPSTGCGPAATCSPPSTQLEPDLVILDLQIGNMGGMATCLSIRSEEGADRLDTAAVLMLLDRAADVFLARRSDADGWLVKPLDAFRLRRAAEALLAGGEYHEGGPVAEPTPEAVVEPDADDTVATEAETTEAAEA